MNPPTPLLVVLAGVALFLVLARLGMWLGVLFLVACGAALAAYAMTRGDEQ